MENDSLDSILKKITPLADTSGSTSKEFLAQTALALSTLRLVEAVRSSVASSDRQSRALVRATWVLAAATIGLLVATLLMALGVAR
jgi:hypothetical protein